MIWACCCCSCCVTVADDAAFASYAEMSDKMRAIIKRCQCIGKGGLGIVTTRVYAALDSPKNELKLPDGKDWTGLARAERETVIVFGGRVFSERQLPRDFRLMECTVVSFEGERITFFDFKEFDGGFYKRGAP